MGRKPSNPGAIPRFRPRRQKSGRVAYYYDHGIIDGKRHEEPLGTDYGLAIKRWAQIEHETAPPASAAPTFRWVGERYMAEIVPTKAPRTQQDNRTEFANLLEFFDDPPGPFEAIEPVHIGKYMDWRTAAGTGYIRANREKSLFSHIWNFARGKGYTAKPNPCMGIKGFKEEGRDVYLEDVEYQRVWDAADVCLRDAMDLAYLTGQRPSDTLRMSEMDLRDGVLYVTQGKTRAKIRIAVAAGGELAELVERIRARKVGFKVHNTRLVVNERGRPIGTNAMSRRWAKACEAAGVVGIQFRDLRAKAGTDKADSSGDIRQAQQQLGHKSVVMTEHYVRKRRGQKVSPTR